MNVYITQLQQLLQRDPADYGDSDIHTLLELLYQFYSEFNPVENAEIRSQFHMLDSYFQHLSPVDNDRVFDLICKLCCTHEKQAFLEGLRVGTQLVLELQV